MRAAPDANGLAQEALCYHSDHAGVRFRIGYDQRRHDRNFRNFNAKPIHNTLG